MSIHRSKPSFLASLTVMFILNACTNQPNYAPVRTDNGEHAKDRQTPPQSNQEHGKENQDITKGIRVVTEEVNKWHLVKAGETLYAIGLSSGYGYQRLAFWNNISPPYKIMAGKKLKLFNPDLAAGFIAEKKITKTAKLNSRLDKVSNSQADKKNLEAVTSHKKQQTTLAVVKKPDKQQKSFISIDNKKILELNFVWPIKGRVLKSFSPAHNKGIDIAGKMGQSVSATEAGKVVYGGQGLIGFGKLLIIKHNKEYLSAYANNSRLLVEEGQQVEKGQVIAEVGKVSSKGSSLHFEIRKNGTPVNPLELLPKR